MHPNLEALCREKREIRFPDSSGRRSRKQLLCEHAKKEGISSLYDEFDVDRPGVLALFNQIGFRVVEYKYYQKFHQEVKGVVVKIDL